MRTWTLCSVLAAVFLSACGDSKAGTTAERPPPVSPPAETWDLSALPDPGPVLSARTTPEGVRILVLADGVGEPSTDDTMMDVHYAAYLKTGGLFDSGVLPLGGSGRLQRSGLLPGWRQGIEGLKRKERRRILIPSAQAYGWKSPSPRVQPGADLVFDLRWTPFEFSDEQPGDGPGVREGDVITFHAVARLASGRVFWDTRRDGKGEPASLPVATGDNGMIEGMFRGVIGMRPGGKRRITIPSHLAYSVKGNPRYGIPANADLVFTVELLEVKAGGPRPK